MYGRSRRPHRGLLLARIAAGGRAAWRFLSDSTGQNLAEMALVLPIIAVLLFGVLDFSRVLYEYTTIGNAAREGARYAIAHPTECSRDSGAKDAVLAKAPLVQIDPNTDIQIAVSTTNTITCSGTLYLANFGEPVFVTVTHRFYPVTPLINNLIGGNGIRMVQSSRMASQ